MTGRSRAVAFALPYVAVLCGLYGYRSGWLAFLLYHAAVVFVLTSCRAWPRALAGFRSRPDDRRAALALGACGIGAGITGAGLMAWLWPWYAGDPAELLSALGAISLRGGAWTGFAVYHALVNPLVEEAYWRGALGEARGLLRPSDLAFAGYHALVLARFTGPWPILLSVVVLACAGAFWRFTYRRTGTLWPATCAHLAADAAIMWVVTARVGPA